MRGHRSTRLEVPEIRERNLFCVFACRVRSTQDVANTAFDRLSDKVESVRERAAPAIDRLASQAEFAARRGMDAVRDTSAQLRESAMNASAATVGRIQDRPVQSMLIAAAAGAALMALLGLWSRARDAR